jgi:hypothetical protein
MSDQRFITPHHWLEQSLQDRQAARLVAAGGLWAHAFHHAGFAVERALKYRIMRRHGWNAWPERAENRAVYSHDLIFLADEAGLAAALLDEVNRQTAVGRGWLIAKDWKNEQRYDPMPFPEERARDMVAMLDDGGLLSWLIEI